MYTFIISTFICFINTKYKISLVEIRLEDCAKSNENYILGQREYYVGILCTSVGIIVC